jgi:hypothetical protein
LVVVDKLVMDFDKLVMDVKKLCFVLIYDAYVFRTYFEASPSREAAKIGNI